MIISIHVCSLGIHFVVMFSPRISRWRHVDKRPWRFCTFLHMSGVSVGLGGVRGGGVGDV